VRRLLRLLRLPQAFDRLLARAWFAGLVVAAIDTGDRVRGRRDRVAPPHRLGGFIGEGDFAEIGRTFKEHFVEVGGLERSDRVLDIGCGTGRMAAPLVGWLDGSYEGFDVSPVGIA
jgi:hypothetical protein